MVALLNQPESKDSSRDAIVRAAISVFAKKGLDGATVKEIADVAGLNVSLISYYFGGKHGLFEHCLRSFGQGKASLVESLLTGPQTEQEIEIKLKIVFEQIVQGHLEDPEMTALIHRELASGLVVSRQIFEQEFSRIFCAFEKFIRTAWKLGFLDPELDPYVASQIMWYGFVSFLRDDSVNLALNGKTLADPLYREAFIRQTVRLYSRGALR